MNDEKERRQEGVAGEAGSTEAAEKPGAGADPSAEGVTPEAEDKPAKERTD